MAARPRRGAPYAPLSSNETDDSLISNVGRSSTGSFERQQRWGAAAAPEPEPEPEPEVLDPEPETPSQSRSLTVPPSPSLASPRGPFTGKPVLREAEADTTFGQSLASLGAGDSRGSPPRSTPKKVQHVHNVFTYSPRWEDRRRHPTMEARQKEEKEKAEAKATRQLMEAVEHAERHTGPLAEQVKANVKFRYGEIFFEETGNVVPYIIAPEGVKEDGARMKAAQKLLNVMVKNMKKGDSKRLSKPNITFQLEGHGRHYLEWAKEVYENDALSAAWGWCPNDSSASHEEQDITLEEDTTTSNSKGKLKHPRTETLQARAERLGACTDSMQQTDLIDAIVAQSQEAIERRTLRRMDRLKDENGDLDFRFARPDVDTTVSKYADMKKKLGFLTTYVERQMKQPDATHESCDAPDSAGEAISAVNELLSALKPDSSANESGEPEPEPQRSDASESDDRANGMERLQDLVLATSWQKSFCKILREQPTLGAKLGLPVDLDDGTVSRMVFDIQRNVQLDDTCPCPIEEYTKKLERSDPHKQPVGDKSLAEQLQTPQFAGIGPKSTMLSEEIRKILRESDWESDWVTDIWGYLEWLRKHTIDLQKVKTYFLCDNSQGSCRTVEDELRQELENLPFKGQSRGIPLDRAMIEFGERMISVCSNIVTGTIYSDGWLLFPAGRGPISQLIGETIERLDGAKGELKDLVWVQYAALRNPRLGGAANHVKFVQQLRDASVELDDNGEKSSELNSRVFYHSDRVLYPTTADVQGRVFDDDGREVSVQDWIREKVEIIEDQKGDLHLHPSCTHLIFWDTEGSITKMAGSRRLEQPMPCEQVAALEAVLRDEGVAKGFVALNGDELDFEVVKQQVSQSDPVLCLQSVGGASDFMASIFDKFKAERREQEEKKKDQAQEVARADLQEILGARGYCGHGNWGKRKLMQEAKREGIVLADENDDKQLLDQLSLRRAEQAIKARAAGQNSKEKDRGDNILKEIKERYSRGEHLNATFRPRDGHSGAFYFKPRPTSAEEELIVIDVAPGRSGEDDAGELIQTQLAQMLTMQSDEREQMLGFKAAEHQRLSFGWDQSLHYKNNEWWQEVYAHLVQIAMLLINLALVALVVFKQAMYPSHHTAGCGATVHDGVVHVDDEHESVAEQDEEHVPLLLMVFKAGLMIMPILNGILLTLDSAFSPTAKRNALNWTAAKIESEIYTYRARSCRYSPVNTSSAWSFMSRQSVSDEPHQRQKPQQGRQIASKTFVDTITAVCNHLHTDGVFVSSHLFYVDDKARKERREEHLAQLEAKDIHLKLEDVDTTTVSQAPKTQPFHDNGYSQLNISEYIACRTEPLLAEYKRTLPVAGRWDMVLATLIFVVTTISVILGSLKMDLYIAISTAAVSFFTGVLEFKKYKETVKILNRATRELEERLLWWDGLTFVERRTAKNKDIMVRVTEKHFMAQSLVFYSQGEDFSSEQSTSEGRNSKRHTDPHEATQS